MGTSDRSSGVDLNDWSSFYRCRNSVPSPAGLNRGILCRRLTAQ